MVLKDINDTLSKSTRQVSAFTKTVKEIEKIAKVTGAVEGIGRSFSKAIQPGEAFNQTLKDIQDSTFLTNDEMKLIDQASKDLAKRFGTDAAEGAKGFKQILTELAPELIKAPEALKAMGENAVVLSKQMGNDPVAATKTLITAMKEYGVSMDDPAAAAQKMTEMMNIMSAASNRSKETLFGIQAAIGEVGAKAYGSKISFSELNAAIILIEKSGLKGANAGKAIDEVLTKMASSANLSKDAQSVIQKYNVDLSAAADTSKSLEERLAVYAPLVHDQTAMIALFGEANVKSAQDMILSRTALTHNAAAITGTNDAYDQATNKLSSLAGWMDKANSWAKDLSIRFNEMITPIKPLTSAVGSLLSGFSEVVSVLSNVSIIMDSRIGTALKSMTTSTKGFLQAFGGSIKERMRQLPDAFRTAVNAANNTIQPLIGSVRDKLTPLSNMFRNITTSAKDSLQQLGGTVKDKISQIPNAFRAAASSAKSFLQPLNAVKDKIVEAAVKALMLGNRLKNDLVSGMKSAALATWGQIKATVAHIIQTGRAILQTGLQKAIMIIGTAATIAATVAQWALNFAMMANPVGFLLAIGAVIVKYWDSIVEKFDTVKEWFLENNIFGGLLGQFSNVQNAIGLLLKGITYVAKIIKGAFGGSFGKVVGRVVDFITSNNTSTSKESPGEVAPKKGIGNLFATTEATPTISENNTHLPGSKNLTQNAKAIASRGGNTGNTYVNVDKLMDQIVFNVPDITQSKQELERTFGELFNKLLHSNKTSLV